MAKSRGDSLAALAACAPPSGHARRPARAWARRLHASMVAEQVVATRPNLPRARLRPERFRDDEQQAMDDDDDVCVDYGEAEPILSNVSKTGYFGVTVRYETHTTPRPFQARVRDGDRMLALGSFATAEQAARVAAGCVWHLRGKQADPLCQPRHEESVPPPPPPPPPPSPPPPPLIKSKNETTTGYFGVSRCPSQGKKGQAPMYQAKVFGVYLGRFVTPEAAARAISARYPEHALAQQEEAAQQTRARPRSKTPQRKTGPRSRGGRAATRRASPEPTPEDAETDVTEDDLLVNLESTLSSALSSEARGDADAAVAKTAAIKNIQKALTARILKRLDDGQPLVEVARKMKAIEGMQP